MTIALSAGKTRLARAADQSAPAAVVALLRKEILAGKEGGFLGSEAELLTRLGVSSPTLRQAARLLEQQQLLQVVRGARGGYFGRRPDTGATARAVALYLRATSRSSMAQVQLATKPLMISAARLAAASTNRAQRDSFARALDALIVLPLDVDSATMLARDHAFQNELLKLAANSTIELFLQVLYQLARLRDPRGALFEARPERIAAWITHQRQFGRAILEGDPSLAMLLAERGSVLVAAWIEDLERNAAPAQRGDVNVWPRAEGLPSVVSATAALLYETVLSCEPGTYLGSEEELAGRLQISRSTLRQAAGVVQHDGFLVIKRGVAGGYVGRRPQIDQVVESAAIYLELNAGSLRQLMAASQSLFAAACRMAANRPSEEMRGALRRVRQDLVASGTASDLPEPERNLLAAEQRLVNLILRMAGNAPIELFVESMYRYGATLPQPIYGFPDRIAAWRTARVRLLDAILEGDSEVAAVVCGRISTLLEAWLPDSPSGGSQPTAA